MNLQRAILDSLSTPVLVVERSGRIVYGNAAAADFWLQPPARLSGRSLHRLLDAEPSLSAQIERVCAEEATVILDRLRLRTGREGAPLTVRVQLDPVVGTGPVSRVVVTLSDQTHLAALQQDQQEEERLDGIAAVVTRLAHELRNPLSGIKGATQLLARRAGGEPALEEFTGVILKELGRLERLVQDLLLNGGIPALRRSVFNVHELLDEVVWFHRHAATGVTIERDYDPSLPELSGDRDRLHQVFLNLIRNAVEASPAGAPVILRTRAVGPWAKVPGLPDVAQPHFLVEVEDRGGGLPDAMGEQLFMPFFTTKRNGIGLGLSISYRIVAAHGGRLRYRAARCGGSVLMVLLPLSAPHREPS